MASTRTNIVELDARREGINVQTSEQHFLPAIVRIDANASFGLVVSGVLRDASSAYEDSLISIVSKDDVVSVPTHFFEQRSLGLGATEYVKTFTDIPDFDPRVFIEDADYALWPIALTAEGFADPANADGVISVFETQRQIALLDREIPFSAYGPKGSYSTAAVMSDGREYMIEQANPRAAGNVVELGAYNESGEFDQLEAILIYADNLPEDHFAFVDGADRDDIAAAIIDDGISAVMLTSSAMSYRLNRDLRSSAAGYSMFDTINGTDAISFMDRKN